jgi:hypothetical protein
MPVVQRLKCVGVTQLGSFNGPGFVELVASLSISWLSVGQVAFSGRYQSDAANYLCVVWLASVVAYTKVTVAFIFADHFYRSWDAQNTLASIEKSFACSGLWQFLRYLCKPYPEFGVAIFENW